MTLQRRGPASATGTGVYEIYHLFMSCYFLSHPQRMRPCRTSQQRSLKGLKIFYSQHKIKLQSLQVGHGQVQPLPGLLGCLDRFVGRFDTQDLLELTTLEKGDLGSWVSTVTGLRVEHLVGVEINFDASAYSESEGRV